MSRSLNHYVLMLSVPVILAVGGVAYYLSTSQYVSTDNAYVQQDKVSVSAEVGGRIVEVGVRENQRVEAGDLLFRVDSEPYALAVAEAKAVIATARARLEKLETAFITAGVEIEAAEQDVDYYEREYKRQLELERTRVGTQVVLQAAEHDLSLARSKLSMAKAEAAEAKAALSTGGAVDGVNPDVLSAQVRLDQALLNLSRTEVRAPVSGVVTQADRLQLGQVMMEGLSALSLVNNDVSWVEANFKETELEKMRIGQTVDITIDSYPDLSLTGHVESIGAGTGSEFSILPAQNATANWVKVTQRVPVRIAIDDKPSRPLIAGLSAYVRINTKQ
ncbi:MAG: HlyD family secretion protein [Spongiibacteraceae bacterium]